MKNLIKLICVLSLIASSNAFSSTLTWSVSTTNVTVNDVFTIDIIGTGFTSNVDGGGVNIGYDSSVLNVMSVSIDESVWDFGGAGISTGTIDNTGGTVDGIMVNTFSPVTGDFIVASLVIQAISSGNSILSLEEFVFNPWASSGSLINPNFVNGLVNVDALYVEPPTSVPVPAGAWLFVSGLIGMIGFVKRKKA